MNKTEILKELVQLSKVCNLKTLKVPKEFSELALDMGLKLRKSTDSHEFSHFCVIRERLGIDNKLKHIASLKESGYTFPVEVSLSDPYQTVTENMVILKKFSESVVSVSTHLSLLKNAISNDYIKDRTTQEEKDRITTFLNELGILHIEK